MKSRAHPYPTLMTRREISQPVIALGCELRHNVLSAAVIYSYLTVGINMGHVPAVTQRFVFCMLFKLGGQASGFR